MDSLESARAAVSRLLSCNEIGLDCEGSNLSRWGPLSLMQLSTHEEVYLCDALSPGVLKTFKPILESKEILKVTHDCREDSSALFHQFQIKLEHVFDTQIVYNRIQRDQKEDNFLISLDLLRERVLKKKNAIKNPMKKTNDSNLWMYRPINKDLVRYAINDVAYLLEIKQKLSCKSASDLIESAKYLEYRNLNRHIRNCSGLEKIGKKINAMLTGKAANGYYFKLNCGSITGIVDLQNIAFFQDLKITDTVSCYTVGSTILKDAYFLARCS